MFERLLTRLEKVHLATTREEREAIYRFRYSVYVEELKRRIGGVDSVGRRVCDEEDEKPTAKLFYVGTPGEVRGTVRLRCWEPGLVPPHIAREYSMDLFPNLPSLRVCEIGRLMIRPTLRGKLVVPALNQEVFGYALGPMRMDLCFGSCRPGLLGLYRRMGNRQYGGRLIDNPEGFEVPLVAVLSDYAYFKKVGALTASQIPRHFGPGRRPLVDTRSFEHRFREPTVWIDAEDVARELARSRESLRGEPEAFLARLDERTTKQLAHGGYVTRTPAGALVTREGHAERELFVVLEGTFEATQGDRVLARMGPGEVFGEVAFFSAAGVRAASVRAVTDGKMLVLRRRFLEELGRKNPPAAQALLYALGRVVTERLLRVERQAREGAAPTG